MQFLIGFGILDDARVELLFPVAGFVSVTCECVRCVGIVGKISYLGGGGDVHGSADKGGRIACLPAFPGTLAWSDLLLRRALV